MSNRRQKKGHPHTAVHRRLSHIPAKDNVHYKSGNHTPKHPLQVFPFKTYLPSTFNAQMCALSRQPARTKRERETKKEKTIWISTCGHCPQWASPGMSSQAYLLPLSHCVRGAHVNLSNWMQRQTLETQNGQTDTHSSTSLWPPAAFFFNFILFFCIQSQRGSAKRAVCEFWFIRQWQRHLYMQLLLYFRLGPTLNLQFSSFLSHEKCKCVLASK